MLGILNVINLSVPRETAFDRIDVELLLAGNTIELNEVALRGRGAALVGNGVMSWPDTGLNITLVNTNPNRWTRVPILTSLVERTSNEIIELQITGPLSRPSVRPKPIPAVSDELRKLFQKKKPRRPVFEERAERP